MFLVVPHNSNDASDWIQRWSHLVKPGATVLDVACGSGRHMKWFAQSGCEVTGIDRSADAVAAASMFGKTIAADIENGPWPMTHNGHPAQFDVVVVTNYLWRPLFPVILQSVAQDGLLLYETFASGNETVGKPSRPDFLLQRGELLQLCSGLSILGFEDGFLAQPDRFVQRVAAFKGAETSARTGLPLRHLLSLK